MLLQLSPFFLLSPIVFCSDDTLSRCRQNQKGQQPKGWLVVVPVSDARGLTVSQRRERICLTRTL